MSATTTMTAPTSKFSYFQFSDTTDANAGYDSTDRYGGKMYIGQKSTTGTTPGANCGTFGILLYDLPNRTSVVSIKSISLTTTTSNSSSGYNDCVARVEYIGTEYNATTPIWRLGSTADQWSLEEDVETTMTTTDANTCANFKSLLANASSDTYYYFRIVRESGQGAWLKTAITLAIEYEEGATAYVWTTSTTSYSYPTAAMTSNSSQSCVASASTQYSSSYAAWYAFNKNTTKAAWATKASDTAPWIQLKMPQALCDLTFTITNRGDRDNHINGPLTGIFYGSNDGSSWTQIGAFTRTDGTTKGGGTSTHACSHRTAYQYARVAISTWEDDGSSMCCIGELEISGTDISATGGWKVATPYTWNGTEWVATTACVHDGTTWI